MAITSGFFDSVNGDRTYDADQMSNYFDGLVSDGVYESIGDRFIVTSANNGMNINVGSGRAIIQSRWVKNDATTVLTLDPSDVQLNRIDAVVLRLDKTARSIELAIKKGTGVSGTPTMPSITRTESVYELYLASVYIAKKATQPTTITDLRPSSYCGWVTGVVQQVDTSDLFLQWQTAYEQMFSDFDAYMNAKKTEFDAWFSTLTSELRVDTTITKYEHVEVLSNTMYAGLLIGIGIPEYDSTTDVLFVYVDGVLFNDGTDKSVELNVGSYFIIESNFFVSFNRTLNVGDEVTFVVLKNVIGGSVLTVNATQSVSLGDTGNAVTVTDFVEVE